MATTCSMNAEGVHRPMEKAYACRDCDAMSDCATALQRQPCPKSLEVAFLEAGPAEAKAKANVEVAPPPEPSKRARVSEALAAAEKEMAHLVMLKGLQAERLRLQHLLALKHQAKTGEPGPKAE